MHSVDTTKMTDCYQCNGIKKTVHTDSDIDNVFYDGDAVVCHSCGGSGIIRINFDDNADIEWDYQ
ncbi:TPA: hypothetical protein PXP42_000322 [Yersinia enterocolitica]|nr:hypothetical protein [Yersinia enterocolitica]